MEKPIKKKPISPSELIARIIEVQLKINDAHREMKELMKKLADADYTIGNQQELSTDYEEF